MPQNVAMPNQAMPGNPNANFGQQPMPMSNGTMPNGQMINDPGFGAMPGYGTPANSGITNPSATGTGAFPPFDPSQTTMQPSPQGAQTYPGINTSQQSVNNSYQNVFGYFGSPADSNDYRPGSTNGW